MTRLFLLAIAFSNCGSFDSKTVSNVDTSKASSLATSNQSIRIADDDPTERKLYKFSNDSVEQKIFIKYDGSNRIMFEYTSRNNNSHCTDSLKGIAINPNPDADPELDEDGEGFGYPSLQYSYKEGDRYLAIRIALKSEDKVVIKASGFGAAGCNYESVGILRLVNRR